MLNLKYQPTLRGWGVKASLEKNIFEFNYPSLPHPLVKFFKRSGQLLFLVLFLICLVILATNFIAFKMHPGTLLISPFLQILSGFGLASGIFLVFSWHKIHTEHSPTLPHWKLLNMETCNVHDYFSPSSQRSFSRARQHARAMGTPLNSTHVLRALLKEDEVKKLFWRFGVKTTDVHAFLHNYMRLKVHSESTSTLLHWPFLAFQQAVLSESSNIEPIHMLAALNQAVPENHIVKSIFSNLGITPDKLNLYIDWQQQTSNSLFNNTNMWYCLQKVSFLESRFHCFFRWQAIEKSLSLGTKIEPLNPLVMSLRLLVKAAFTVGRSQRESKIVTEETMERTAYGFDQSSVHTINQKLRLSAIA